MTFPAEWYNENPFQVLVDPDHVGIRTILVKVLNWLIALCGLWQFGDIAAFFVPGFGTVSVFIWNHVVVGFILMFLGSTAALTSNVGMAKKLDWIAAIAGIWLMVARFILGIPEMNAGLWNDLIVGLIVFILGVWASLSRPRSES